MCVELSGTEWTRTKVKTFTGKEYEICRGCVREVEIGTSPLYVKQEDTSSIKKRLNFLPCVGREFNT
jgi:hypothetical protein